MNRDGGPLPSEYNHLVHNLTPLQSDYVNTSDILYMCMF